MTKFTHFKFSFFNVAPLNVYKLNLYFVDFNYTQVEIKIRLLINRQMGCVQCKVREIIDILDTPKRVKEEIENNDFFQYASNMFGEKIFTRFDKDGITTNDLIIVDSDQKYQKYVQVLQDSKDNNDLSTTKILSNLYYRYNQQKEKGNRKSAPQDAAQTNQAQKYQIPEINMNIIKYFIFFYTADKIYSQMFKKDIRQQKYNEIAEVVTLLIPHISQHINNQQKERILAKSEYYIFKGFPSKTDKTICQLRKKIGSKGYFGSFFLAETRQANASIKNSWITIKVNPKIKHQFLIVKPPYIKEKEAMKFIIFPFFHYKIDREDTSPTKTNVFLSQTIPLNPKS